MLYKFLVLNNFIDLVELFHPKISSLNPSNNFFTFRHLQPYSFQTYTFQWLEPLFCLQNESRVYMEKPTFKKNFSYIIYHPFLTLQCRTARKSDFRYFNPLISLFITLTYFFFSCAAFLLALADISRI
ncbi:MAG: hypothetical protein K0R93_3692 [Anaerosolibacter sp.]|nr:hypothetical protein [Anaerosolibacter sp.]